MSKKAWIIFVGVCVVLLGVLVYVSIKDKVDVSTVKEGVVQPAVVQSGDIADHVYGKTDSNVMLIEYGDYQCPGCHNAYPVVKSVVEKYKDKMTFIFRNFPLTALHPNARAAAASAEAAGLQGKYWEMHDLLYEGQDSWKDLPAEKRTDFFADYAKSLGLKVDTFKTDLASEKVNRKINFDIAVGKKINVDSTPSFFLDGKLLDSATWSDQTKLDAAVAKAIAGK